MLFHLDGLIKLCKSKTRIYIYGAGMNAKRITSFLLENNIAINGYIVSDMTGNSERLFDLPVVSALDFQKNQNPESNDLIVVSIGKRSKAYLPVFEIIIKCGWKNVVFLPDEFLKLIKAVEMRKAMEAIFTKDIYYLGTHVPVEEDYFILALSDQEGTEYHWRIQDRFKETDTDVNVLDWFSEKTALEEHQEQYGRYYVLHSLKGETSAHKVSCTVYMAHTYKDKKTREISLSPWTIPIQVGASLAEQKVSQICDNQGKNISEKNGIYSECTALYWMWKHASRTDYIGLCHYRRHFDMSEEDLGRLWENEIDVLVTAPTFVFDGIGNFFASLTPEADREMLLQAMEQVWPAYFETAKAFFQARFFPPCNLSIMRYDLFQEYAEFVFSVTFKIEEFYDGMGFYRRDRYMGYLVECLLGIFLMHNKERLRIAYTDMLFY